MKPLAHKVQPERSDLERRRHSRLPVYWEGRILHDEGEEVCTVLDFSPGGARIQTEHRIPLDAPISLKLTESGEFAGHIAWIAAEAMGVQFGHLPLD